MEEIHGARIQPGHWHHSKEYFSLMTALVMPLPTAMFTGLTSM
jgi:hypothetical protein